MNTRLTKPDLAQLSPAQNTLAYQRARSLQSATPAMTVDDFLWLHTAIFTGIDPSAGLIRGHQAAFEGYHFARPELIGSCLNDRFADLIANDGYRTADRSIFYNGLAHHLSELHAIAPFSVGNLRTIATHGEQLARAADHVITTCDASKPLMERALYDAFVHDECDQVAALLSGGATQIMPTQDQSIGVCGTARLADRFVPRGRRQFMYLDQVQAALDDHLAQARAQAEQRVAHLNSKNAPPADLEGARRELTYLNHPKGVEFQRDLLAKLNVRRFEVIVRPDQSALERIRELGYGLMIALDCQSHESVEAAHRQLRMPHFVGHGSPHQARMADQFLRQSAAANRSDPRFAAVQRLVDDAGDAVAQMKGRDTAAIHQAAEHMRQGVANRIRTGEIDISGGDNIARVSVRDRSAQ